MTMGGALSIGRFVVNPAGIGRTIAYRIFIAVQQFKAASLVAFSKALRLRLRMRFGRFMQFVLPNVTTLPPTREAGLVQIAFTLIDAGGTMSVIA